MAEAAALSLAPTDARWRVALMAGLLASAGLPLYVHLPRFVAALGLPLASVGGILLALRVLDFVQDPLLGRLVDRMRSRAGGLAALALLSLGGGFAAVFAAQPGLWLMATGLVVLFTAYSLGTILLYALSVEIAASREAGPHLNLAAWRESGALVGVLVASVLPAFLAAGLGLRAGYAAFGIVMALAPLVVWWAARPLWAGIAPRAAAPPALRPLIAAGGGWLLALALLNVLPVAVTATLFLFFVEDHLRLGPLAGAYLAGFFLAAAVAAPGWAALARRFGTRPVLAAAMLLAIAAFGWAAVLPAGAAWRFGAVTLGSGAAVGAELVLLPALFAALLARHDLPEGLAFGLWSFAGKLALALAAALVLPVLSLAGYVPGTAPDPAAARALVLGYAVLPCLLKLLALGLLLALPRKVF
ncbi:MFS transporter [Jhaorihella thermophila]|uniref:Na+/melibiose symporter n=1 Tax=Jhaorihella thermophila TaxID=488547 RepID=A0A1H5Z025_9RHOB|nr:MFS transporter [Jhaorihella thermophila]SEG29661.1 Na+/melibiose symporter [Jhaorihella thermophila]